MGQNLNGQRADHGQPYALPLLGHRLSRWSPMGRPLGGRQQTQSEVPPSLAVSIFVNKMEDQKEKQWKVAAQQLLDCTKEMKEFFHRLDADLRVKMLSWFASFLVSDGRDELSTKANVFRGDNEKRSETYTQQSLMFSSEC